MSSMENLMKDILSGKRQETAALLQSALDHLPTGLLLMDADNRLCYANPAAYRIFSAKDDEELTKDANIWLRRDDPSLVENQGFLHLTLDGRLQLYTRRIHLLQEDDRLCGMLHVVEKASKGIEEHLAKHFLTTHDPLTGVYNRQTFYTNSRRFLNENPDTKYLLLRSNIRDFKLVNSFFGEDKGNEILLAIANILFTSCTDDMVYGRLENDHFVILLPEYRLDLEDLRQKTAALAALTDSSVYALHFQFGLYRIQEPDINVSIMCDRAKLALASITGDELCSIAWYADTQLEQTKHEREVISALDRALQERQIQPYLQAQVDENGILLGAEVLARWIDRSGNVTEPVSFVSILENAGIVYKLDRFIWEEAARILARWTEQGHNSLTLSVNISLQDIYYIDIESYFADLVKRYGLSPSQLNLEFTESTIMSNAAAYSHLVSRLHRRGFHIEIDDFGSGYSSLNMLKDIPADCLKLDMHFLAETVQEGRSQVILESVLSMASRLSMPVITEGVSSQAQVDFLSARGCHRFQGYFFSRPVSCQEFEKHYGLS